VVSLSTSARGAGRRAFLLGLGGVSLGLAWWSRAEQGAGRALAQGSRQLGPDEALQVLLEGNQRFVAGRLTAPGQIVARRNEVAPSQAPIAAIVGCSDSRVPPELVFDQSLGDLFVTRLAGNIVDEAAQGSLEFAVDGLGASLIVVLGHQRCGAVAAAVQAVQGGAVAGYLSYLVETIAPAARLALGRPGDVVDNAIRANVERVVSQLAAAEPVLAGGVREGRLRIVGAYYSLDTGVVSLLT
jgi:carbonic anhydrase